MVNSLSIEQQNVYEYLNSSIFHNVGNKLVFIDGPGGTGKSYVLNTFINNLEKNGVKYVCVAWTGIAANLLPNGETAHICFKLPLTITHDTVCNIKANSAYADYLRNIDVIIWDEISMVPKHAFECVNRCLQDVCNNNKSFGDKYVILAGDFRQTLPIVKHGTRSDIVEACVKSSKLWPKFKQLKLTKNLRLLDSDNEFDKLCMNVGNGVYETEFEEINNFIPIPENNISNGNLIDEIFGETINCYDPEFSNSIILALTNDDVIKINADILDKLSGEKRTFLSIDTIDVNDTSNNSDFIPIEFLNSLVPNGLPLHKLELKIGAIVILLRNLNDKNGLCNGTRLQIVSMRNYVIEGRVLSGNRMNEIILLPRIDLKPNLEEIPINMIRRQFPVRLGSAITINKSQGQSFNKVGIYLSNPVFSHGQLYVALTRIRYHKNLKILLSNDSKFLKPVEKKKIKSLTKKKITKQSYTKNIVYLEVL